MKPRSNITKKLKEESHGLADSDSDDDGADITFDPVHLYKQILDYLQPGETVSKALCRLGKFYYFIKYILFYSRSYIHIYECVYVYICIYIHIYFNFRQR